MYIQTSLHVRLIQDILQKDFSRCQSSKLNVIKFDDIQNVLHIHILQIDDTRICFFFRDLSINTKVLSWTFKQEIVYIYTSGINRHMRRTNVPQGIVQNDFCRQDVDIGLQNRGAAFSLEETGHSSQLTSISYIRIITPIHGCL